MKVAIFLVGNIRTWDKCKSNFLDTFQTLNYDVFVSTYDMQYGYHPAIKNTLNINKDFYLKEEEILASFNDINLKNINIENTLQITQHINDENNKFHNLMKNIHSCYGQYRKLKDCLDMMREYEKQNNFEYDFVIKTRCDTPYNKFDFNFKKEEAVITSRNCYPNDWIIITDRNSMINLSNFIINEFYSPKYSDSNNTPPHGLLLNAFKHHNLKIVQKDINTHIVRSNTIQYY